MELDDLKKSWKESTENIPPANNIMELIHNKSNGPLAILKKRFRKRLILLPLMVAFVIINLSRHHAIFSDALFWCFIAFCIMMCGYFLFSYRLMHHFKYMETEVKANLERQVKTLEKIYRVRLIIIRAFSVLYIVLLEVLLYYNQEPSLVKWYAQPLFIRLSGYAAVLVILFFVSKYVLNHKYGRHIKYLKELVGQMQ